MAPRQPPHDDDVDAVASAAAAAKARDPSAAAGAAAPLPPEKAGAQYGTDGTLSRPEKGIPLAGRHQRRLLSPENSPPPAAVHGETRKKMYIRLHGTTLQ